MAHAPLPAQVIDQCPVGLPDWFTFPQYVAMKVMGIKRQGVRQLDIRSGSATRTLARGIIIGNYRHDTNIYTLIYKVGLGWNHYPKNDFAWKSWDSDPAL